MKSSRPASIICSLFFLGWMSPNVLADPIKTTCTPSVSDDRIIASIDQRLKTQGKLSTKLFAWPDTPLGVVKSGSSFVFFASDGSGHANLKGQRKSGSVTRSVGTLDNVLGTETPIDVAIEPNPDPSVNPNFGTYTYLGGGPVYRVPKGMPGAGNLLMVTHAEITTPKTEPKPSFYSLLNLAASKDGGKSWVDLGEIIRINHPYMPDMQGFEISDPPLVLSPDKAYFYIYFKDWLGTSIHRGPNEISLAVARASTADVLKAAFGDHPHAGTFSKYFNGEWSEPGLGGRSSDIGAHLSLYGDERQVAYSSYLKRYLMLQGSSIHMGISESVDGLNWTSTVMIKDFTGQQHQSYLIPVGTGEDPTILDKSFYVYYTWYPTNGAGWQAADLRRFTVTCEPAQ